MKKVLFLITKSNWGGAQRYVYDLATALPMSEYEAVVALGGEGTLKAKLEEAGVRVITIPNLTRNVSLKKEILASRAIARIVRSEQPDVLHVNSSKAGAIGACIGRLQRVPRVIFTAHGWAFNEDRGFVSRLLIKTVHWLTVALAHHTIAVSHALRTQMNWPFVQKKMSVIHLGQTQAQHLSKEQARTMLSQKHSALTNTPGNKWLVSIGELHPVKQHRVAIDAIAGLRNSFPSLQYVIIGDGELRTELESRITELSLTNTVHLLGYVDNAAQYLAAADVFVFPSRSEALGYVALEAAQVGVPTVASNVGGIPEVILDGQTGTLVPNGDSQALAAAIADYLQNPSLCTRHGNAAKKYATSFTIERMIRDTLACYKA